MQTDGHTDVHRNRQTRTHAELNTSHPSPAK